MFNRIFSFFSDAILENCPNSASLGMDTTSINESVPDVALRAMRSSPDEPLSQSAGTWDPPKNLEHQGRCDSGGWAEGRPPRRPEHLRRFRAVRR